MGDQWTWKKLSGIDTRYFKHKWVSRLQISRKNKAKPTPTKPSKKNEHIRAPSKQLRDQSEQACDPLYPLPINRLMLKIQQQIEQNSKKNKKQEDCSDHTWAPQVKMVKLLLL